MIARIAPAGRQGDVEMFAPDVVQDAKHGPPGPAKEIIFAVEGEGGPGGVEGNDLHRRPEAGQQIESERFGQESDVKLLAGLAQKRRGNGEVAHAPEFDDQQFWLHDNGFTTGKLRSRRNHPIKI